MNQVVRFYKEDIKTARLESQLEVLTAHFQSHKEREGETAIKFEVTCGQVNDYVIRLGNGRQLSSEIVEMLRLILVMLATNATSERSFFGT